MKHYGIEQWADFARGLCEPAERDSMSAHLAAECRECGDLNALFTRVHSACERLTAVEVPEYAVRMARAIFPVRVPDRPKRGNRLPIELIFDSFLAPVPVGLRATWQVGWQALYKAGECSVDLRIEPELKSARAAVIGQIVNHAAPASEMGDLAISLRAGKIVIAETHSNEFGEFQMEYPQQTQLKLCIHLRDSRVIQVPLRKVTSEQAANKSRVGALKP